MKFLSFPLRVLTAVLICFLFLGSIVPNAILAQTVDVGQTADDDRLPDGRKSDGCTLIGGKEFKACCVAHDRDYFFGGSAKDRRKSDNRLFDCVAKKKTLGAKLAAPFIWLGVRIGGLPFLPTSFRWGFGKRSERPRAGEPDTSTATEMLH